MIADMTAPSPAELAFAGVVAAEVDRLLDGLDTRDRQVLALRFGLGGSQPRSLEDVGQALRLSKEGVRQSQARALRALKRAAALSPETRELLGT
jgi:DNA-directed RNA polymerase sigma subunit (sigma70/sigma32)